MKSFCCVAVLKSHDFRELLPAELLRINSTGSVRRVNDENEMMGIYFSATRWEFLENFVYILLRARRKFSANLNNLMKLLFVAARTLESCRETTERNEWPSILGAIRGQPSKHSASTHLDNRAEEKVYASLKTWASWHSLSAMRCDVIIFHRQDEKNVSFTCHQESQGISRCCLINKTLSIFTSPLNYPQS